MKKVSALILCLLNYIALDATEPGIYMFTFSPADDPVFRAQAGLIVATLRCF